MAALARRARVTLLLGSLPERIPGASRVRNTSVLLGPDGATLAVYRKVHLFDIDLPGMEHLKESEAVVPRRDRGGRHPAGPGRSVDLLRPAFPGALRELARRGARVLCVPSAFTERTGKAHWEVLLRARAIENLAYVLAPAQVGHHGGGRASHGQAMIVEPWGTVVAQVPDGEGLAVAEIDLERLERIRRELPALRHARLEPPRRAERPSPERRRGGDPEPTPLTDGPKCHKNSRFAILRRVARGAKGTDWMPTYIPKAGSLDRRWFVIDASARFSARWRPPRYRAHRQAQADLHTLPRHGRPRRRGQRGPGRPHRQEGDGQGLPPPHRVHGRPQSRAARDVRQEHPTRIVEEAVRGMLPKTKLGRAMFLKLKVYPGPKHPHQAQKPQPLNL